MDSNEFLDELARQLAPRLKKLGVDGAGGAKRSDQVASSAYDRATCELFLNGYHVGDSVIERAKVFFGRIAEDGEISSKDLVTALTLKGPTSIPANLTNSLKKSARRLEIDEPWIRLDTSDGIGTIWRDRDGIAARMLEVIDQEFENRGLASSAPS